MKLFQPGKQSGTQSGHQLGHQSRVPSDRGEAGSTSLGDLGPVTRWLNDDSVNEVLINGPGLVWVERDGRLQPTTSKVEAYELAVYVERIVAPLGLRLDRLSPIVDTRLADGSRVNIVIPPVALDGPCISIRRFGRQSPPLTAFGPPSICLELERLIAERASMLIVGGTGSGKTSLINALSTRMGRGERVVCIEDTAELRLVGHQVVRLETKPANSEGLGAVSMRQLVTTALRMRPDRLIVGEVRGAEALELVLALTAGHQGSLATCHATGPSGGLRRLALLASLAPEAPPLDVLERFVCDAFDVVVHVSRCPDSARRQVRAVMPVGQPSRPALRS